MNHVLVPSGLYKQMLIW